MHQDTVLSLDRQHSHWKSVIEFHWDIEYPLYSVSRSHEAHLQSLKDKQISTSDVPYRSRNFIIWEAIFISFTSVLNSSIADDEYYLLFQNKLNFWHCNVRQNRSLTTTKPLPMPDWTRIKQQFLSTSNHGTTTPDRALTDPANSMRGINFWSLVDRVWGV